MQMTRKSESMQQDELQIAWWVKNIEELDREIARLGLVVRYGFWIRGSSSV